MTLMTTAEAIIQHVRSLPESAQQEVLDFVVFLETRRAESSKRQENAVWSEFSLDTAMRGMEDEDSPYTLRIQCRQGQDRSRTIGSTRQLKSGIWLHFSVTNC